MAVGRTNEINEKGMREKGDKVTKRIKKGMALHHILVPSYALL
jgi:hypothetical protein